ncbi:MAG: sulfite exporter TauE/SafE family protein [Alphaproteobacteria bacterium]|nr:sulfite exporter TauE/SafE family protein [Alphaproteobacteria bacterium]
MALAGWASLASVCFVAALLQATSGFGFAVLAVPFFLLLAPPNEVIRLIVVISLATSLFVMPGLYRSVDRPLLVRLTLGSLVALPLGLFLFTHTPPLIVRFAAGGIVTFFAAMLAWQRRHGQGAPLTLRPMGDVAAGAVAGGATALVGMAGPPVLIYLLLGGAPMRTVRATLIAFFALVYAATLFANAVAIGMGAEIWVLAASLLPFVWLGGRIGLRVGERLGDAVTAAVAIGVLAAAGLYTLAAAAHAAYG